MQEWLSFLQALKESLTAAEAALLGTVIGSALTWLAASWNQRKLKEIEADQAYNAKLLDKQMQIYNDFEKALQPFFNGVAWGRVLLPRIFCFPDEFYELRANLKTLQLRARWMTRETQEDLQTVMSNLHKLERAYQLEAEGKINRVDLVYLLVPHTDKLMKHISGLLDSSHRDVINLHRRKKEKPVYYAPSEVLHLIEAELKRYPLTLQAFQDSEESTEPELPNPKDKSQSE